MGRERSRQHIADMNIFLTLAMLAVGVYATDKKSDMLIKLSEETCDTVFCSLGQECVVENKKPVCACIDKCTGDLGGQVCGSVGAEPVTYMSQCHLYKDACERPGVKISMVADEACELKKNEVERESVQIEKDAAKEKPVVCMEKDRDELRIAIIKFVSDKLGIATDSVSYKGMLLKYFYSLDLNDDKLVDTEEFMTITEQDAPSFDDFLNHKNPVLRALCSTELIAFTDLNFDYKLGFDEFFECLNPEYEAPKLKCELRGSYYEEGQDVDDSSSSDCNSCTCACGHWVCSKVDCELKHQQKSNRVEDNLKA